MADGEGHRRSARISALDACKAQRAMHEGVPKGSLHEARVEKQVGVKHESGNEQGLLERRRGRKKRKLRDMNEVVGTSIANQVEQVRKNQKNEQVPKETGEPLLASVPPTTWMPERRILHLILDILQKRDIHEIFAEPVDPQEVDGYYEFIKEPMDFATMRTKLHEGMYKTLEQFEHDVFLISSNAMHFNSSTTIYFRQARALQELSKKVFHGLRTNPESFELDFSLMRQRAGRKPQNEPRGGLNFCSHAKPATEVKPSSMIVDVASKSRPWSLSPSLGRNIQPYLGSSSSNPHGHRRDFENLSAIRDGRKSNFSEVEQRWTYRPGTSLLTENESIVSTPCNSSKSLMHVNQGHMQVNQGGIGYRESLTQFVKDLGPTAQMVANRKLQQCQVLAPSCQIQAANSEIRTSNCQNTATSVQQGPTPLNGVINISTSQNPDNFTAMLTNISDRTDILGTFGGQMGHQNQNTDILGTLRGQMGHLDQNTDVVLRTSRGKMTHQNQDTTNLDISRGHMCYQNQNTDILGTLRGQMGHLDQNTDILRTSRGKMTHQNQNTNNLDFSSGQIGHQNQNIDILGASRGQLGNQNQKSGIVDTVRGQTEGILDTIRGQMGQQNQNRGILDIDIFGGQVGHQNQNTDLPSTSRGRTGNQSQNRGILGTFRGQMSNQNQNTDILGIYRGQMGHPNQNTEIQLGSNAPTATVEDLNFLGIGLSNSSNNYSNFMADASKFDNQVQPVELTSKYSQPELLEFVPTNHASPLSSSWPLQDMRASSSSQPRDSTMRGFGSHCLGIENQPMAAQGPNYGISLPQPRQVPEWSSSSSLGTQPVFDMSFLQSRLSEMYSLGRDGFEHPELRRNSVPVETLFDATNFHNSAPAHNHQADPSTQAFLEYQQRAFLDNQQPDLALQL